ncbi:iron ABC transporter permease [Pseudonocardia ailaonensis]|uniref:Iron ABC transporter permease n=1 Tax=Pseudonocardia ailaonensis TaxID=367279 RepID=A0ABN2N9Y3_9PSEU
MPSIPLLVVLAVLILVPVGLVALAAVSVDVPRPGGFTFDLTLANLASVVSGAVGSATINSLGIATAATVLAVAIGGYVAFVTARTDAPFGRAIYACGLIPMFLPSYVGALAWAMLGSPASGLLNVAFRDLGLGLEINVYSRVGLVLVCALFYAPYAFLLIHASMTMMNPDLEDAAAIHGGSRWRMLRSVTFPLALPAVLGSALLIFVLVLENFPVAQVLATPGNIETLPTYIYRMMGFFPSRGTEAAALAVVLVAFVVLLTLAQRRVLAKRSFTTVTGKGMRARRIALGRFRWLALVPVLLYFVASIVLPLGALLVTSLRTSPFMPSFSSLLRPGALDGSAFGTVFADAQFWSSTVNSVIVAVAAALGGTVLSFAVAYVVYRTSARARAQLEAISMLPLAIPALVLGMGILWTWLLIPLPLYGTLGLLVVAFLGVQMPQGLRSVAASIRSTDRDLEDSAVVHGRSRVRAVLGITVPLMKVALSSTFLLLLMLSMRELTVPLLLYTRDTTLLSVAIFDRFENGGGSQSAAAISLVYCLLMFVLAYLPRRFGQKANA